MGRKADVSLTTTIDFADLNRRLTDAENKVFNAHREGIVEFIKGRWTGWIYKGRPAAADRLVSHQAWSSELETTENRAVLLIFNHARSRGKAYSAYVHRSGNSTLESVVVWAEVKEKLLPALKRDLIAAVSKALTTPGKRRKLAGNRTAARTTRSRSL